jgi:hypothetical protein
MGEYGTFLMGDVRENGWLGKKEYQRYVNARLLNQQFYFVTAKRLLSVFHEYTTMICFYRY